MPETIPLALAINKTSRLVKRYLDRKRRENGSDGSTQNQGRIIGFVYNNPEKDVFQKDIEKEFGIRRSTATNTLKLMEKNGMLKRERVSYDERMKKITLTQKSMEIIQSIDKDMKKFNKTVEKGITEVERKIFLRVLDKIKNNIEEVDCND